LLGGKVLKVWECREGENFDSRVLNGQITNVYSDGIGVKVSNGEIVLKVVQPEGKGKMSAVDFARGMMNKEPLIGRVLE
jgi:methionyl-tRNA formyltransferase